MAIMLLFLALSLLKLCLGQTSSSACFRSSGATVIPVSTAFAQCSYLNDKINSCTALPLAQRPSCYCQQNVVNAIVDCENEQNECIGQTVVANQAQELLSIWHSNCDTLITFSPTTPAVSSPTSVFNEDFCSEAVTSCEYGRSVISSCEFAYTTEAQRSSCICNQNGFLAAVSVCDYDGNKTCYGAPAFTSDIPLWTYCEAQVSTFLATRQTVTSGLASSLSPLPTPGPSPATKSASTTQPASSTTQPAASTTSSGATSIKTLMSLPKSALVMLLAAIWFHV